MGKPGLTEAIIGGEAASKALDRVEEVELEAPAEVREEAEEEAGDPSEVSPHRHQRRRPHPGQEPPPEYRGQRSEILRR